MTPLVQVGAVYPVSMWAAKYQSMRPIRLAEIKMAVCEVFGVSLFDLESRRRARSISWPRQVGYWVARQTTMRSLPEIARDFHVDHTTILHGLRRVEVRMSEDPDYRSKCLKVIEQMEGK